MHKDIVGNYINIDDEVAYAKGNGLYKGTVTALTLKMVRIKPHRSHWHNDGILVFPSDCIIPGRMPP